MDSKTILSWQGYNMEQSYEIINPNEKDPRFNKTEVRIEQKKQLRIHFFWKEMIKIFAFVTAIMLFKILGRENLYQEWYHLLWQWFLIVWAAKWCYGK